MNTIQADDSRMGEYPKINARIKPKLRERLRRRAGELELTESKAVVTAVEFWLDYQDFLPELMLMKRERDAQKTKPENN